MKVQELIHITAPFISIGQLKSKFTMPNGCEPETNGCVHVHVDCVLMVMLWCIS